MALDIKDINEAFKDDIEREQENREQYQEDVKFAKLGEQWPEQVKQDREREGRPCLTINRMPSFIRQVVNDSRINIPQIKVKPVDDDADVETAEIYAGLIRNIEYVSQAEVAYDTALDAAATGGMGFFKVVTDYCDEESFAQDIYIRRITNPLSIVPDSYGESIDGSDWMRATEIEWMPEYHFEKKFGKKADKKSFAGEIHDQIILDDSDLIRVASFWHVDEVPQKMLMLSNGVVISEDEFLKPHPDFGVPMKDIFAEMGIQVIRERKASKRKVTQYVCGADILETNEWAGKWIPIVPVYGEEVFVDGKRYLKSLIHDAKDAQMMFNYWRTSSTETVALAPKQPYVGPVGAFDTDAEKWATANIKNWPYIEYDGQIPPQRQMPGGADPGALQEAMNASDDMKAIIGLYDASLGARSNETSGIAINARKKEGDISTFHFTDNLAKSIAQCGRILVDLIPKIYDKERIIRVLGEDGESKNVVINKEPEDDESEEMKDVYRLNVGKYDVAVDTGPSFTTQREEAAAQMTELVRSFPAAAPLIGDLLAKNLGWPDADEIAKRLKAMLPPQIQQMEESELPPEAQAKVSALENQLKQMSEMVKAGMGEFQKMRSEMESMKADKSVDMKKLEIEAYNAETKRIEVQIKAGEMVTGTILEAEKMMQPKPVFDGEVQQFPA